MLKAILAAIIAIILSVCFHATGVEPCILYFTILANFKLDFK